MNEVKKEENLTPTMSFQKKFLICFIGALIFALGILWIFFYLTKSPFIGTWVREIEEDGTTTSIKFEVNWNKTFIYEQQTQGDTTKSIINGKWEINDNILTMHYILNNNQTEFNMYLLDRETICMGEFNCSETGKLINTLSPKDKKYVIEKIKTPIIDIDYNKYLKIIQEDKDNIIILATKDCSHCIEYRQYVMDIAQKYNLTMYFLDISNLSFKEYNNIHDSYFQISKYDTILTPTTIIVRNSKEIAVEIGNIGYEGLIDMLKENNIIN